MNSHQAHAISPVWLLKSLVTNWAIILNLAKRDAVGRYRGSTIGLLWSFFNPVLILAVYTFVFSVVFNARWAGGSDSKTEFALVLFAGLLVFNLFSECFTRAPGLILGNVNFVKKVIFPLEILPVVTLGSALLHFSISLAVWISFYLIFFGMPGLSILQLPLAILPLVLLTLGLSWFLASLGVFLRDIAHFIGVATTVLMLLSPIFFPIAALPEEYRPFMQVSPLTFAVEQARDVLIWNEPINWNAWLLFTTISSLVFWGGFAWFQTTRKGFADVL